VLTNAHTHFHFLVPGKGSFLSNCTVHEIRKRTGERNYSNFPHCLGWWLLPLAACCGELLQEADYMENGLVKDMG